MKGKVSTKLVLNKLFSQHIPGRVWTVAHWKIRKTQSMEFRNWKCHFLFYTLHIKGRWQSLPSLSLPHLQGTIGRTMQFRAFPMDFCYRAIHRASQAQQWAGCSPEPLSWQSRCDTSHWCLALSQASALAQAGASPVLCTWASAPCPQIHCMDVLHTWFERELKRLSCCWHQPNTDV